MSIFFFSSIIFPFGKRESGNDQLAHHLEDALCSTTKKHLNNENMKIMHKNIIHLYHFQVIVSEITFKVSNSLFPKVIKY